MTVTETKSFGQPNGHIEYYRGAAYEIDFLLEMKIEFALDDNMVEKAVRAIHRTARVGRPGAGKIFVSTIDEATYA
jgi:nitrogen regulatory protein P-II 1